MADALGARSSLAVGATQSPFRPGALFVDGNYRYVFNAWCSVAGVTIALRSRFLRAEDRQLVDSGDVLSPPSDRSRATIVVPLGVGNPVNVDLFAVAGSPRVGQCFVQVQLIRGDGPAATIVGTIAQGYVTTSQALAWPGSPIVSSTQGEPAVRPIVGAQPVAGVDIVETVPTGARWQLLSFGANFSPNPIGNRQVSLTIDDGANLILLSPGNVDALPAGSSSFHFWPGLDVFDLVVGTQHMYALPNTVILLAGSHIRTATNLLVAADQWFRPFYSVLEWLDLT
jgi:hypothetical protein